MLLALGHGLTAQHIGDRPPISVKAGLKLVQNGGGQDGPLGTDKSKQAEARRARQGRRSRLTP